MTARMIGSMTPTETPKPVPGHDTYVHMNSVWEADTAEEVVDAGWKWIRDEVKDCLFGIYIRAQPKAMMMDDGKFRSYQRISVCVHRDGPMSFGELQEKS